MQQVFSMVGTLLSVALSKNFFCHYAFEIKCKSFDQTSGQDEFVASTSDVEDQMEFFQEITPQLRAFTENLAINGMYESHNLRWIKEWICSDRPITIGLAILDSGLSVTSPGDKDHWGLSYRLHHIEAAHQRAQNVTFGLFVAAWLRLVSYPHVLFI